MKLTRTGSDYMIDLRPDTAWLDRGSRKWPVTLDPTVTFAGPERDCAVATGQGSIPDQNSCASAWLPVGAFEYPLYPDCDFCTETYPVTHRALLKFNLGGVIPADAVVRQAKLGLYGDGGGPTAIDASGITRAWTNGATWNRYDGVNPWTTPGGDAEQAVASNPSAGAAGWSYWYPTDVVRRWTTGTTANNGLLLKAGPSAAGVTFRSSDYGVPATNPYLEVTLEPPFSGDTTITTGPSGEVSSRDASFEFTSTDPSAGSRYELAHKS